MCSDSSSGRQGKAENRMSQWRGSLGQCQAPMRDTRSWGSSHCQLFPGVRIKDHKQKVEGLWVLPPALTFNFEKMMFSLHKEAGAAMGGQEKARPGKLEILSSW